MKKKDKRLTKRAKSDTVANLLAEYVGEDVADVVRELTGKPDYSEFKLADALSRELNATRNLLYKLHSLNLVSFTKKKDNKIGWYIYYWTFHEDSVNAFLLSEKKSKIEALKQRLAKEGEGSSYSCTNKCARLDFDNAFDFSFRCPECGELLGQDSNKVNRRNLEREIIKLEKGIKRLELVIKSEKIKKGKKRLKTLIFSFCVSRFQFSSLLFLSLFPLMLFS